METISSVHNPKVKYLTKLRDDTTTIKQDGQLLIEGWHLINEAFANNLLTEVYILPSKLQLLSFSFSNIYLINERIVQKLSSTLQSQGVFGVCKLPPNHFDTQANVLILDDLQDPGNMGTLIRSAAAFNFKNIIASKNSVGFYNPKIVRATQGMLFNLHLANADLNLILTDLKTSGYMVIGTIMNHAYQPLLSLSLPPSTKIALVIGNEAKGISANLVPLIDLNVKIEMAPSVESLNAAVAGSILMYAINKMRA